MSTLRLVAITADQPSGHRGPERASADEFEDVTPFEERPAGLYRRRQGPSAPSPANTGHPPGGPHH